MDTTADDAGLPIDIDAQPLVQAAAAMRPVLRRYHEEIEREQCLPTALVEQLQRSRLLPNGNPARTGRLAGRSADLPARRGAACRGRWLGRLEPCQQQHRTARHARVAGRGRARDLPARARSIIAGTAVQGGGQAVPVDGGYRVNGHWTFGSGCQESAWMLGSFQILDGVSRAAARTAAHSTGGACFRALRPRSFRGAGTWPGCAAPAASTGR